MQNKLLEKLWKTEENFVEICSEFRIHPVVDNGIDTRICHCKPVKEEVEVSNVSSFGDGRFMKDDDEVDMVRSPAHHED